MSDRPTFFNKWKRSASEHALKRVFDLSLQAIPCKIVRTSLRWAYKDNLLHTFPAFDEALYNRLGLYGFQVYRQVIALRQKSNDVDLGIDKSQAAWESYCKAEVLGGEINRRMRPLSRFLASLGEETASDLLLAAELIGDVLGEAPAIETLHLRFGPGANVSCRGKTSARYKLSAQLGVSQEGLKDVPILQSLYPRFFGNREIVVEQAEVSEVPKNARTFRTIEFQPLLNTFVQLGIGAEMKYRMKLFGINLYTQELNKRAARAASKNNHDATVDTEGASDSMYVRPVEFFLSRAPGWFELLSTWRCGDTTVPSRGLRFNSEKFSAMGNGYTFELESLIFWALAKAVCINRNRKKAKVLIFGDDLILPSCLVDPLITAYASVGFRVNREKSFFTGSFRESCGGDYVLGYNVRPFYVKDRLTTARLVAFHNFLHDSGCLPEVCSLIQELVLEHDLTVAFGPPGLGDGHLVTDDPSLMNARCVRKNGYSGWKVRTFVKVPSKDRLDFGSLPNDHLLFLYLQYQKERVEGVSFRPSDPYVLRGSERTKSTNMYVFTLDKAA